MNDARQNTVAIVGAGEMGSAVGRRLSETGARVITELKGRSPDSAERVRRAGLEVIADDDALAAQADFLLSIVPPGVAVEVAQRFSGPISRASKKLVFVECNAVSPATTRRIAEILAPSGCAFVDAGIIGGPPPADTSASGPRIYASGEHAYLLRRLARYGLDIAVLDGPVGAASGLKMSYAGLTKGMTAIGTAMIAGASRHGLADALCAELARSQPELLKRFKRSIPAMLPKAYRWVAEMQQIAEFLDGDENGGKIYQGAACLYETVAAELEHGSSAELIPALTEFCKRPS